MDGSQRKKKRKKQTEASKVHNVSLILSEKRVLYGMGKAPLYDLPQLTIPMVNFLYSYSRKKIIVKPMHTHNSLACCACLVSEGKASKIPPFLNSHPKIMHDIPIKDCAHRSWVFTFF